MRQSSVGRRGAVVSRADPRPARSGDTADFGCPFRCPETASAMRQNAH